MNSNTGINDWKNIPEKHWNLALAEMNVPEWREKKMRILICGLNGTGESTIGRMLANHIGYEFIGNENLFFPKADPTYAFSIQEVRKK